MDDEGAVHLEQDFDVPDGAMPIRMQTADLPVTVIGWIASAADLPDLLESVAAELREVLRARTPGDGDPSAP